MGTSTIYPGHVAYPQYDSTPQDIMLNLKLTSENALITELCKILSSVSNMDEDTRKFIQGRVEAAEGRKAALVLSQPNA